MSQRCGGWRDPLGDRVRRRSVEPLTFKFLVGMAGRHCRGQRFLPGEGALAEAAPPAEPLYLYLRMIAFV